VAYDGQEALTLAKVEKPDLILLDIMLPKVNGFKVSRLLKFDEVTKNIPIIMITARTQGKDIKLGEETGADAYVTKPFDMIMLTKLVKGCLNSEDEK
jgi:DNA-binding response OmpR family regulator